MAIITSARHCEPRTETGSSLTSRENRRVPWRSDGNERRCSRTSPACCGRLPMRGRRRASRRTPLLTARRGTASGLGGWAPADAFLEGYRQALVGTAMRFVPEDDEAFARALAAWELDKALYEVAYEARNRPDWLELPAALATSGPYRSGGRRRRRRSGVALPWRPIPIVDG